MIWKDKKLKNVGDMLTGITSCKTKDDANKFINLYKKENPNALADIGYIIGYASADERARLYDLFGDIHPVFRRC